MMANYNRIRNWIHQKFRTVAIEILLQIHETLIKYSQLVFLHVSTSYLELPYTLVTEYQLMLFLGKSNLHGDMFV